MELNWVRACTRPVGYRTASVKLDASPAKLSFGFQFSASIEFACRTGNSCVRSLREQKASSKLANFSIGSSGDFNLILSARAS